MSVLADIGNTDTSGLVTLLVALLGLAGVGIGIWLLVRREYVGAAVAVVIGLVVLVVALG